ncbi:hypothetical protein ACJX0J_010120 [Zea mays]
MDVVAAHQPCTTVFVQSTVLWPVNGITFSLTNATCDVSFSIIVLSQIDHFIFKEYYLYMLDEPKKPDDRFHFREEDRYEAWVAMMGGGATHEILAGTIVQYVDA